MAGAERTQLVAHERLEPRRGDGEAGERGGHGGKLHRDRPGSVTGLMVRAARGRQCKQ
jgi:hypothetical protein